VAAAEAVTVKVELTSPGMTTPLRRHWSMGAGRPEARAEKVTVESGHAVCETGMVVKRGGTETEREAVAEVVLPQELETMQS
jgi:hypothetical protein